LWGADESASTACGVVDEAAEAGMRWLPDQ
jgi:hypothetical protein